MSRRHEPLDVNAALVRLAGQVDRLQHDVADLAAAVPMLRGDVEAHSRALADLAEAIRHSRLVHGAPGSGAGLGESAKLTALDGGESEAGEPEAGLPDWLSVSDPEQAVLWLSDLDQWTRDVWRHHQQLTVCWPWHPGVVAELLCCRHLHAQALAPGAALGELAVWLDRWRPGAAGRIGKALAACENTDGRHIAPRHSPSDPAGANRAGPMVADPTALDELAVWWATTHGASGPPPGLSTEDYR